MLCAVVLRRIFAPQAKNRFVSQTKTLSSFHRFNKFVLFIIKKKTNVTRVYLVNCSSFWVLLLLFFLAILSQKVWFNEYEGASSWANMRRQVHPPSLVTVHLGLWPARLWKSSVDTSWCTVCFSPLPFSLHRHYFEGQLKPEGLSIIWHFKLELCKDLILSLWIKLLSCTNRRSLYQVCESCVCLVRLCVFCDSTNATHLFTW